MVAGGPTACSTVDQADRRMTTVHDFASYPLCQGAIRSGSGNLWCGTFVRFRKTDPPNRRCKLTGGYSINPSMLFQKTPISGTAPKKRIQDQPNHRQQQDHESPDDLVAD